MRLVRNSMLAGLVAIGGFLLSIAATTQPASARYCETDLCIADCALRVARSVVDNPKDPSFVCPM